MPGEALPGLLLLVPSARLELAQLSPLPPQDSVSTNFTTTAIHGPYDLSRNRKASTISEYRTSDCGRGHRRRSALLRLCRFASYTLHHATTGIRPMCADVGQRNAGGKNTVAATPVARLRKLAEPAAPNTLPAEPLPNAAPMSAPLPCCKSTSTRMAAAATTEL